MKDDTCDELRDSEFHGKQAIAAALLACGRPVSDTASEVKVAPQTVHRWLADPGFRRLVSSHREVFIDEALGKLASLASRCVDRLAVLLDSPTEGISLKASLGILDRLTSLREHIELSQRVDELERRVGDGKARRLPSARPPRKEVA